MELLLKECRINNKRKVINEYIVEIFDFVRGCIFNIDDFHEALIKNYIHDLLLDSEYDVSTGQFYTPVYNDVIPLRKFAFDVSNYIQEHPDEFSKKK